jgi:hypothetical protein
MAITKIEVPELFDFGSDNSAFKLPTGTTAERPTSPSNGEMRFNTTTGYVEYYDTTDTQWWEIDYEALCTTNDPNYPITNLAYYKMSNASDSTTHVEFATWDPNLVPTPTLYNGNLRMYGGSTANGIGYSNQSVSSGKHYWEHTVTAIGAESSFGIARPGDIGSHYYVGGSSTSWGLYVNGNLYHNSAVTTSGYMSGGFSNGDIIGAELDLDNGTLKFYKNGTGYGNAFTGLTGTFLVAAEWRTSGGANDHITNFGASSWAYNPSTGFVGVSELASYNGTATNVNFNVAGKFGNAGEFNGSSSYINISSLPELTANRSVSMWFKAVSIDNNDRLFGSVQGSNYFNISFGPTNNISAYTGGTLISSASNSISTNVWHNVVLVANGTSGKLYIDGNEVTSTTITSYTINPTAAYIGTNEGNVGAQVPNASIDQIRIFSSALNATQVTQLYNEIQCVPTIVPSENFNTVLYTGDSTARTISTGFAPDLVWIKNRNNSTNSTHDHSLFDSVRTTGYRVRSNSSGAANDYSSHMSGFTSGGFNLTTSGALNDGSGSGTYVSWNWKAGGAAVSNTDGTITSQVSANVDAGFSIVKYTGNNSSSATIGHGLGKMPAMVMTKMSEQSGGASSTSQWMIYHKDLTGNVSGDNPYNLYFSTNAELDLTAFGAYDNITTDVIPVTRTSASTAHNNNNLSTYVAYCFAEIAGYSKIGSYTGNGSATGPIVTTGFEPAWVMIKRTDGTAGAWSMFDNKRDPSNPVQKVLQAQDSAAESNVGNACNFNSNNFQLTDSNSQRNTNGGTYIFMAFAADPT